MEEPIAVLSCSNCINRKLNVIKKAVHNATLLKNTHCVYKNDMDKVRAWSTGSVIRPHPSYIGNITTLDEDPTIGTVRVLDDHYCIY